MLNMASARLPGVPLHLADMRMLDLGRQFDAVICVFTSIGYVTDPSELPPTVARLAAHVATGGVLILDGWIRPAEWSEEYRGDPDVASDDEMTVVRLAISRRVGHITEIDTHHLVRTDSGIEHFVESHRLRSLQPIGTCRRLNTRVFKQESCQISCQGAIGSSPLVLRPDSGTTHLRAYGSRSSPPAKPKTAVSSLELTPPRAGSHTRASGLLRDQGGDVSIGCGLFLVGIAPRRREVQGLPEGIRFLTRDSAIDLLEPVDHLETEIQQVVTEMSVVQLGGTNRCVDPIHQTCRTAARPQHVVLLEIPVNESRSIRRPRASHDLDEPLPFALASRPLGRPGVAEVIPDRPLLHMKPARVDGMNWRQQLSHVAKPRVDVPRYEVQATGHPGHQNGRNIAFRAVAVDGDQTGRGDSGYMQELEVSRLLFGEVGLLLQPGEEQMPAEDQVLHAPIRRAYVNRVDSRRAPTAEAPDANQFGACPDRRLDPAPRPRCGWLKVRARPAHDRASVPYAICA